ncbi:MAG: tRNA (adenosine(37)-N6)-threonylcarbamoyltransferase complex transferase subunit TsaD, partial [Acidobacteriota bacterium]|nr:tRNA (adenosine(37)-N6)-threonylcarbamoyltransferase complex transferase subunit TsaD [Acidobacteriota bacterium]
MAVQPPSHPVVLGIETSCDDTACALVDGGGRVLASTVSSQLAAHRPYGGVVPEIASREHLANWLPVSRDTMERAGLTPAQVDVVAATRGPGLVGSLLVGLSIGKAMAFALGRPFHAVHHLEGHLYSPFLAAFGEQTPAEEPPRDFVGLVLSGGHSSLFAVSQGTISTLGETRDDAIGEVFDKVGKRLGIPYPQGPRVDELAERGDPGACKLPVPTRGKTLDFSYSGLKSQALAE